jgi:hypothetical protein
MKASDTSTHSGVQATRPYAQRFRNQATGVGQTLTMSESVGAMRSQRVIDAAPPAQLAVADYSYPDANPSMDTTGTLRDKLTGKPWKVAKTGPHL